MPAASAASRNVTQQLENHSVNTAAAVFVARPPNEQVWPKAFFGGSGHWAIAHMRQAFAKNAYGPVGIPLIRGASGAGRLTQPPQRE